MKGSLAAVLLAALLPRAAGAVNEPEPKDESISRRIVVIDPGHGGRDLGAVANKVSEKDLDLAISRRMKDEISRLPGMGAVLTRDADEFLGLSERVERAHKAGGAAFISLHADKTSGRGREGVILYIFGKNRSIPKGPPRLYGETPLPPPPQSQVAASRRLALHLERSLRAEGLKVGEMDRGAFAVLKSPQMPSLLLEVGNLRDRGEARSVSEPRFQQRLARAVAAGLKAYFAAQALSAGKP